MSITPLPSKDSSTIYLTKSTPIEIHAQLLANSDEWRGALSLPGYLRREEILANQDLTRNGGLTSWVLVDKPSSPKAARRVLAGCESIRKKAFLKRRGTAEVQEVVVHGVASVFTPPSCRGVGYGGRMIKELGEALKEWQREWHGKRDEVVASVLYSDIGKQFYNKHGSWLPYPSTHLTLPPTSTPPTTTLPQTQSITPSSLPALIATDIAQIRTRLTQRPTTHPTALTLLPDLPTLSWHHTREEYVGAELFHATPDVKGALAQIPGTERRVWAIWTRAWYNADVSQRKGNVLYILRLVVETEGRHAAEDGDESEEAGTEEEVEAVAAVLGAAQGEAERWGMERVEVWSPGRRCRRAVGLLTGVRGELGVVEREAESIASLKWFGDEGEEVRWLECEKFGWC